MRTLPGLIISRIKHFFCQTFNAINNQHSLKLIVNLIFRLTQMEF